MKGQGRVRVSNKILFRIAALIVLAIIVFWVMFLKLPSRADYPLQGVDVSQKQGEILWPTAAADGVDFAYLRITEGAELHDTRFPLNWEQTAKAGIRRGAYHLYSLCRLAHDQATNFIAHMPREKGGLPPALMLRLSGNCEERPAREVILREIAAFIRMAEAHTMQQVMLMIYDDFEVAYQISEAIDRPVWLRSSLFPPTYAVRPWQIWQSSTMARVDGISGSVHWNVMRK